MRGNKLLDTLILFTKDELNLFGHYLNSPSLDKLKYRKDIQNLFNYIKINFKNLQKREFEKNEVYSFLFPDENPVKGKLDKIISGLLKQLTFFIEAHFYQGKKEVLFNMISLSQFYYNRQDSNKELNVLKKAKRIFDQTKEKDKDIYFRGFLINKQLIIKNYLFHTKTNNPFDYDSILQPLDVYYLLNKLEFACLFLSTDRFRKPMNVDNITSFIDDSKLLFQSRGLLEIPLVNLYYHAYDLLKNMVDSDYWKLKEVVEKHEQDIPKDSRRILIRIIRNYLAWQYNHGAFHLLEELFEMNKNHLQKGYLNVDKGILPSTCLNLVTIGLRVKAFDWVYQFLQDYRNKIEGTDHPEDVYHFNMATYYFSCKQFNKAIELLEGQYEDLFYKIASKRLELKIYYETKTPIMESRMDAFKIYIFRLPKSKILDHQRQNENNFINFLRRIHNPKTAFSKERIDRLAIKIKETKLLSEKDWLLEKLEELKK